ncbi:MAG: NAD-dependent epimerase/dehydratase family protein [Planctomycetota bacterium]
MTGGVFSRMSESSSQPERVFVSGASGFVGTNVVEELVSRGIEVSALVHNSPVKVESDLIDTTKGGLFDADSVHAAMDGCDAAIHLVGIIMEKPDQGVTFEKMHVEGTKRVLAAAEQAGVKRYIHMSALGSRPSAVSRYHQTKWDAEVAVRETCAESDMVFTIFRPSMIHGPRGEFMQQAAGWALGKELPYLFMPYFGKGLLGFGGSGKIAPVYVKDVARLFVEAPGNLAAYGMIYNVAGPHDLDWPAMHHVVSKAVRGKKKAAIPVPAWYAKLLTKLAPASWLPFNLAQVQMSQEDNVGDITELRNDFAADLAGDLAAFEPTVQGYVDELKAAMKA